MTDRLDPPASEQEIAEARELARLAGLTGPDHALVALVRSSRARRHLVRAGAIEHAGRFPPWDERGRRGKGGVA